MHRLRSRASCSGLIPLLSNGVPADTVLGMEALFSVAEAAALLGLSPTMVSRLCQRGKLSGQLVGGTWIVSGEEVERYRQERIAFPPRPGRPRKPSVNGGRLQSVDSSCTEGLQNRSSVQ